MSNAREHRRSRPCRSREAQKRRCQCRPLSQKQNLHCGSETRLRRPQGRSSRFFKYCQAAFGSNQRAWGAGLLLICPATALHAPPHASCSLTLPKAPAAAGSTPRSSPLVRLVSVVQCTNGLILVSLYISEVCGRLALTVDRTEQ